MTKFYLSDVDDTRPLYTSREFRDVFRQEFVDRALESIQASSGRDDIKNLSPAFEDDVTRIYRSQEQNNVKSKTAGEVRQAARDAFQARYGKDAPGNLEVIEDDEGPLLSCPESLANVRRGYGDDIMRADAARLFRTDDRKADRESIRAMQRAVRNPDAPVTIYRAVHQGGEAINPNDWVTLSKSFAEKYGQTYLGEDYKVLKAEVAAGDVLTDAGSINQLDFLPADGKPAEVSVVRKRSLAPSM